MEAPATVDYGNPNSFHGPGRRARVLIEQARGEIGGLLGAGSKEVIFTSGGTESISLGLRGAVHANAGLGRHVITSATEHEATLQTCALLEREGFSVTRLLPDSLGALSPERVQAAMSDETCLIAVMHANNETGIIQPIAQIAKAVRERRASTLLFVDAVQSVGHLAVDVKALDVDLLAFTAHKFYGPKGVGGLYVRQGTRLEAAALGGGQECGWRGGTESVPLIVGMATALRLAEAERIEETAVWGAFRDEVEVRALAAIPLCRVNSQGAQRLSHFTHLSLQYLQGEDLVLALDRVGIGASSGSACHLSNHADSVVLEAMGVARSWARGSLRFSFGHASRGLTPERLVYCLQQVVAELRSICPEPLRRFG
jgi:cysteine desulfurase